MPKYQINYSIIIEAEDRDEVDLWADDIESQIAGIRGVKDVWSDPYVELVE